MHIIHLCSFANSVFVVIIVIKMLMQHQDMELGECDCGGGNRAQSQPLCGERAALPSDHDPVPALLHQAGALRLCGQRQVAGRRTADQEHKQFYRHVAS